MYILFIKIKIYFHINVYEREIRIYNFNGINGFFYDALKFSLHQRNGRIFFLKMVVFWTLQDTRNKKLEYFNQILEYITDL